jgi:hypothetical protein
MKPVAYLSHQDVAGPDTLTTELFDASSLSI